MKFSLHTLDRIWTGLLAVAIVLLVREGARGAECATLESPEAIYRTAWLRVASTYIDPSFNNQDWTKWAHKYDGHLKTMGDVKSAIQEMTASLGDCYTRVAEVVSEPAVGQQAAHGDCVSCEKPVRSKRFGEVGYISISSFTSPCVVRDFQSKLVSLASCEQLILDLRGNRGGSVTNALEIADMLLNDGKIMTAISREGRKTYTASGVPITSSPIIVLVDENTASAAEILTGALRDNHRAIVMGSHTFGKGLIQEVTMLPGNMMLYVTSARYTTPSGDDINGKGIMPDVQTRAQEDALEFALTYAQTHS